MSMMYNYASPASNTTITLPKTGSAEQRRVALSGDVFGVGFSNNLISLHNNQKLVYGSTEKDSGLILIRIIPLNCRILLGDVNVDAKLDPAGADASSYPQYWGSTSGPIYKLATGGQQFLSVYSADSNAAVDIMLLRR